MRGEAKESDCIFKMREKIQRIADQLIEMEGYLPKNREPGGEENEP